jgi:uncharacterized protein YifE (UPF0438 family)
MNREYEIGREEFLKVSRHTTPTILSQEKEWLYHKDVIKQIEKIFKTLSGDKG